MSKEKRGPNQEGRFEPAFDGRPVFAVLATIVIAFVVLIAGMWFCFFSYCALAPADPRWVSWSERGQYLSAAGICLGISIGGIFLIIRINRKK